MSEPLTDTDPMPFGVHRGKPMQDVPSSYLDWLIGQDWIDQWPAVKAYIENNLNDIHRDLED